MFITGLGTAVPLKRYSQLQCWEALRSSAQFPRLERRARAVLQKVLLGDSGIRTRHLALDPLEQAFETDPDTLHRRFARHAPELAASAAQSALRQADVAPGAIDAVIISTCTGYLCPGLTSYVAERLGLRQDVLPLDLVGQGCSAALPNLRTADALIASGRCETALSVCVEVCSAAFYLDNDPGVLISACLFGDGAGAAVVSARPIAARPSVQWKAARSLLDPSEREALRFEQRNGMLRNILTPQVPALAARSARVVLDEVLMQEGLSPADIADWIWHAGGTRVLEALREALGLSGHHTRRSAGVLSEFGNLSSPFVYFVLEQALRERAPGGWWWMSSFGAGFSCHGALLRVSA